MSRAAIQEAFELGLAEGRRSNIPSAPRARRGRGGRGRTAIPRHVYEDEYEDDYEDEPVKPIRRPRSKTPKRQPSARQAPPASSASGGSQWMGFAPQYPEY